MRPFLWVFPQSGEMDGKQDIWNQGAQWGMLNNIESLAAVEICN